MQTFKVTLITNIPVLWDVEVQAETKEKAAELALALPWEANDPRPTESEEGIVRNGWNSGPRYDYETEGEVTVEFVDDEPYGDTL